MQSFPDRCSAHAELESFDPGVFYPDDKVGLELCAFIVTLAGIYNDAKDIGYAMELLVESRPVTDPCISRPWGIYLGLKYHIARRFHGLLHELFQLIQRSDIALADPYMRVIESTMSRPGRESWHLVLDVARGADPKHPLGKALLLIRNKVAFHYDASQIHRGYTERFTHPSPGNDRALLSRGTCMRESRFYFADAAFQCYLENIACAEDWDRFHSETESIFGHLNHALMELVTGFIQKRAGSFRQEQDKIV